jgi:hypothetical protein
LNTHFAACANNAHGNFAAIGNENFFEQGSLFRFERSDEL